MRSHLVADGAELMRADGPPVQGVDRYGTPRVVNGALAERPLAASAGDAADAP